MCVTKYNSQYLWILHYRALHLNKLDTFKVPEIMTIPNTN